MKEKRERINIEAKYEPEILEALQRPLGFRV
jgi:hypothetical protein